MHPVLAQATEITQAASRWGDQAPILALGFLSFGLLVIVFLRHLKAMADDARAERGERDALFTAALKEISDRSDARAKECHVAFRTMGDREREVAKALADVRREIERSRK